MDSDFRDIERRLRATPDDYLVFQQYLSILQRNGKQLTPLEEGWQAELSHLHDDVTENDFPGSHWYLQHLINLNEYLAKTGWKYLSRFWYYEDQFAPFPPGALPPTHQEHRRKHLRKPIIRFRKQHELGRPIFNFEYRLSDSPFHYDAQGLGLYRTSAGYYIQWMGLHNQLYRNEMNQQIVGWRCVKPGCMERRPCSDCIKRQLQGKPQIGGEHGLIDAVADYQLVYWYYPNYI